MPNLTDSKSNQNIINILLYLQENYLTVSLKEMSAHFNYSERQISRIIHDNTGMSFSENIQKLKINKAHSLLLNSNISIMVVATKSGFTDSKHFRQTFKKFFGFNPAQYREINSNKKI